MGPRPFFQCKVLVGSPPRNYFVLYVCCTFPSPPSAETTWRAAKGSSFRLSRFAISSGFLTTTARLNLIGHLLQDKKKKKKKKTPGLYPPLKKKKKKKKK